MEIVALAGLPEVAPGDDLEALIGDALEATPGVLPLEPGDVLVVTQKVVSKAEGAVVDLRTVTPSPGGGRVGGAPGTATRARSRSCCDEAVRIVRKANGVLIVETHHGFVCANAGVDAATSGPASGDLVTLLPRDPDASAARIRAAIASPVRHRRRRHRLGQLRAAVALGHRGRRDRRLGPRCRSRTSAARRTPTGA